MCVRLAHFVVLVLTVASAVSQYEGYFQWTPTISKRAGLYCPETCMTGTKDVEECCACEAIACCQFDPTPASCDENADDPHLEYTDIFDSSFLLGSPYAVNITHFRFSHYSGRMRTLTDNVCNFPNLLSIEAANNFIYVIGDISCLHELNILDLSNNEIQTLHNTPFSLLTSLRVLKLANNKIEVLDDNSLNLAVGSILLGNPLYEIDITNVVTPGETCLRNFSNVKATDLKNDLNYKLNTSDGAPIYGPSFVDFSNSNIGYSANFTTLGVSFAELNRYLSMGFTFVDSQINCDCAFVPLLKNILYPEVVEILPDLLDNMTCFAPPHMRGFTITAFYDNVTLDSLTCDIKENCPKGPKRDCTCTDTHLLQYNLVYPKFRMTCS